MHDGEVFKVRLTFEPSGRPIDEQNYYTQDKVNVCVVCGADNTYIRKSVIPHEYRRYVLDHRCTSTAGRYSSGCASTACPPPCAASPTGFLAFVFRLNSSIQRY